MNPYPETPLPNTGFFFQSLTLSCQLRILAEEEESRRVLPILTKRVCPPEKVYFTLENTASGLNTRTDMMIVARTPINMTFLLLRMINTT